jgi:rhodanese-related sulfurtransferase
MSKIPKPRADKSVDQLLSEARSTLTPRLQPNQAYEEMRHGATLVDIRHLEQRVRDGEIPGAVLINRNEFEWRCDPSAPWRHEMINKDDYKQRIIVLCNQGFQSSFAAANLVRIGLSNATDIEGGMQAWLSEGLPVVPFETSKMRALLVGIGHLVPVLSTPPGRTKTP